MIHLYAPPGDFPATLCGLNRDSVWGGPYAAVYGTQIALVNCPDCLARASHRRAAALPPEVERGRFTVQVALWVVALVVAVVWVWLS